MLDRTTQITKLAIMWTYIHDALTHKVIASGGFTDPFGHRWSWVQEVCATEYFCNPDEIGCVDTDEQRDCITAKGVIVAYLERGK